MSAVAALPLHRHLLNARSAIQMLSTATHSWMTIAPNLAAVDAVIAQSDAISRVLGELRPTIVAEFSSPRPPQAA